MTYASITGQPSLPHRRCRPVRPSPDPTGCVTNPLRDCLPGSRRVLPVRGAAGPRAAPHRQSAPRVRGSQARLRLSALYRVFTLHPVSCPHSTESPHSTWSPHSKGCPNFADCPRLNTGLSMESRSDVHCSTV